MSKKPAGRRKHFGWFQRAYTYCGRWRWPRKGKPEVPEVVREIEDVDCMNCLRLIDEGHKHANNGKEHPVAGPRRRKLGYN